MFSLPYLEARYIQAGADLDSEEAFVADLPALQ
jgi:hypothetical protein